MGWLKYCPMSLLKAISERLGRSQGFEKPGQHSAAHSVADGRRHRRSPLNPTFPQCYVSITILKG